MKTLLDWPARHLRLLLVLCVLIAGLGAVMYVAPLLGAALIFGACVGVLIGVIVALL